MAHVNCDIATHCLQAELQGASQKLTDLGMVQAPTLILVKLWEFEKLMTRFGLPGGRIPALWCMI